MGTGGGRAKTQPGVWGRRRGWEWGKRGQGCAGWLGRTGDQCRQQPHRQDPCQSIRRGAGGHMSPKLGLLMLPARLAPMGCQAVPKGFTWA